MKFRFGIVLSFIATALIGITLEECVILDILRQTHRIHNRLRDPPPPLHTRKYIKCQKELLTSDFHTKIEPLMNDTQIEWLQVGNTSSAEIAAEAFSGLQVLQDLRINGADIQVIRSQAFDGLFNLSRLSLRNNKISNLDESCFNNLTNLIELDLSFNSIVNIKARSFAGLHKLQRLYLANNYIDELSPQLFQELKSIDILDLSFNKLIHIDAQLLRNLSNLMTLWMNNNDLKALHEDLFITNQHLKNVYINNNFLMNLDNLKFPKSVIAVNGSYNLIHTLNFCNFTDVKIIDLSGNGLMSIRSNSFDNLTVKELYLDQNYLGLNSITTETFSNFSLLEKISISNNQIKNLTPNLFKNNNQLKTLNLASNFIGQADLLVFPKSLENLNLASNNFNSQLNITCLTNLKSLNISFNDLTKISFNFLEGLNALSTLDLRNNKINTIKIGCFRDLKALKELYLSNNNISVLELGVFIGIDNLQKLDISHNKLNVLPEGMFHNLQTLHVLNFGFNNISFISVENTMSHISWFTEVDLDGNNWSCSLLTNMIQKNRRIHLKNGGNFNVTNVNGIACKHETQQLPNSNDPQNKFVDIVASKLTVTNNLLIFILVIITSKFILKHIQVCWNKTIASTILSREKNEQELQLIQ